MAISKVIYKSSPNATPETWMDATTATAAAADITSPKTAMLADGVMTTGTGTGGGGSSVKTGTVTPASRSNSVSFDIGMSSITGLLIIPTENPLLSGGKTFVGGYLSTEGYWKTFFATSNNAGSGLLTPAGNTSTMKATISGTVITVYSIDTNSPSINAGSFEAITYRWYAW